MSVSLLNFGMLFGLIAISVPLAVHFLNRRRFDVVYWGAMQFLQLGERTRQRIKLSDLLLLLLRMAVVALLVLAFTRPFVKGNTWIRSLHPQPVDLVLIIDSSYSMGWAGETVSPHARAIQQAHNILDDLTSVDRVAIIDARNTPLLLTPAPLTDTSAARLELEKIQQPDGAANLIDAIQQGCQLLTQSFSSRRQIFVLTDQQQSSWKISEQGIWNDMLKVRHAAAVPIDISVLDVGTVLMTEQDNIQVEPLKLSHEVVVRGTPVTFTTRLQYTGPLEQTRCEVNWSINGQQLLQETETFHLRQGEQVVVQFTARLNDPGSHVVRAAVESDSLPGDDAAEAVVEVIDHVPVTIVTDNNSTTNRDLQSPEFPASRYLQLAYGNPDEGPVWVLARQTDWQKLSSDSVPLQDQRLVFATVSPPETFDWSILDEFVNRGGAVVLIPPTNSQPTDWLRWHEWKIAGQPVLPMQYVSGQTIADQPIPVQLQPSSFSAGWLEQFRLLDTDLNDVTITEYWPLTDWQTAVTGTDHHRDSTPKKISLSPISVDARLDNDAPVLVRRFVGRGQVMISALPFAPASNNLVGVRAFVPFVHELVFGLTRASSNWNRPLGEPLILQQIPCQPLTIPVNGPDDFPLTAQRAGDEAHRQWVLPAPRVSGLYRFAVDCQQPGRKATGKSTESLFCVTADRAESLLTRLTDEEKENLTKSYQIDWQTDSQQMLANLADASSGVEVWPFLLLLVTGFLIWEMLLTRKLVQGGHVQLDQEWNLRTKLM